MSQSRNLDKIVLVSKTVLIKMTILNCTFKSKQARTRSKWRNSSRIGAAKYWQQIKGAEFESQPPQWIIWNILLQFWKIYTIFPSCMPLIFSAKFNMLTFVFVNFWSCSPILVIFIRSSWFGRVNNPLFDNSWYILHFLCEFCPLCPPPPPPPKKKKKKKKI